MGLGPSALMLGLGQRWIASTSGVFLHVYRFVEDLQTLAQ